MRQPRKRDPQAKPVQLQPRDKEAFVLLYLCDGLMLEDQLVRYCYANTHPKNATTRLLALFDNRYLSRNWRDEAWKRYPRIVYWLGERGYEVVEEMLGREVDRKNKLVRSKSPHYSWTHHFQVIEVLLKVMQEVSRTPDMKLWRWRTDGFFRSNAWKVKIPIEDETGKVVYKAAIPDGFFPIAKQPSAGEGRAKVFGYVLEVDRGTEPQQSEKLDRFTTIADKLRLYPALFDTPLYQNTFGLKTGRCLMVTSGWERAEHMMELAQEFHMDWAWYFTTYETATDPSGSILTDPLWKTAGQRQLTSLIPH
jgi:hypothetical protein